jgi:serine/threonine-protein kinase
MTEPAQAEGLNEAQEPSLVGQVLSERYRIDAVLGEGGMGAVYRAEHLLMHKRVAIKVLHPEMTRMPEVVQRFEREAMAAANIDHPHVAAAYDFGKLASGAFFLVLEYVEGKALRDVIADEGGLSVDRAVYITRQVLQALSRAHGMGIVHRDLKPENVMLVERDGDPDFVKVLDFGIAKVPVTEMSKGKTTGAALTQLGMVYGTPEYMAPEQALGQDVDLRADLYALGVLLFEMLTGKRPFDAANPVQILGMVVSLPVPSFATVCPERKIPTGIEDVTRKLLAKLADDRYPDARSAIQALDAAHAPTPLGLTGERLPSSALLGGRGSLVAAPALDNSGSLSTGAPLAPATAEARKKKLLVLVLGLGLGLIMLLALVLLQRGGSDAKLVTPPGPSASASAAVSAVEPAPDPTAAPGDAEIQAAAGKGIEALEALKARAPRDPKVLRALARAQSDKPLHEAALATLGELFAIDASAALDRSLQACVVLAAQAAPTQNAAFDLIEAKMGPGGPDTLYALQIDPRSTNPKLQKRAKDLFARKDFLARVTPALDTALDLRAASGAALCSQHRKLFQQARDQGDSRSLRYLSPLTAIRGCGFLKRGDCYSCLRSDNLLNEAMKAINEREKGGKDAYP